ncbi:MAG: phosphoribosylanthranilate isomerase [Alphaproteobacteria bacterium]|nr:phosphoribosylanthranilate isomerase [Alphaproteobacteria bacterium]
MSVSVKICGIRTEAALQAAIEGGADYIGFVFYPPSPRAIAPEAAAKLAATVPLSIKKVGLFVDPHDDEIKAAQNAIDIIQLHGDESPARVKAIRLWSKKPVIKAIRISSAEDLAAARYYEPISDLLLFDAKTHIPGGTGTSFDWNILRDKTFSLPWMLAGGLNISNIQKAVEITRAQIIDISSGVEDEKGIKSPTKITALLKAAKAL